MNTPLTPKQRKILRWLKNHQEDVLPGLLAVLSQDIGEPVLDDIKLLISEKFIRTITTDENRNPETIKITEEGLQKADEKPFGQLLIESVNSDPIKIIVILALLVAIVGVLQNNYFYQNPKSPPSEANVTIRSLRTNITFDLSCDLNRINAERPKPQLSFVATNVGSGCTRSDLAFVINTSGPIANNCGENISFFKMRQICSFKTDSDVRAYKPEACQSELPILCPSSPLSVEMGDLDTDVTNFYLMAMNRRLPSCNLTERISICPRYDDVIKNCSEPITVNIHYSACDK